jgi:FtsP/CotA-like multicopper oxidase with cupredoxin domain
VTAGERLDVLVTPTGPPGGTLVLRALLYNRGYGSVEYRDVEELLTIEFTDEPPLETVTLPTTSRTIAPPTVDGASRVPVVFTLPPAGQDGTSEFRVNGVPYWEAKPFLASLGEKQIWNIRNDTDWDHPFHLHGFFFIALDEHDRPMRPLVWKDTLNIPRKASARFLVEFDERPGEWMFHCHILDHADGGLMGTVRVGPGAGSPHGHPKNR